MSHSNGGIKGSSGHAVSRSQELLSCAKTSWKITQQKQHQQGTATAAPTPNFQLASPSDPAPPDLVLLEDGLTLLRSMEYGLKQLQLLVRRRGHTNDPTQDIATLTSQLEQDTQELTEFCQSLLQKRRRSPQERKHWEYVVQWFQQIAAHYSGQLQECLKLRGEILTEQAQQRRKLTAVDGKSGKRQAPHLRGTVTATPLFDSPLFTAPPPKGPAHLRGPPSNGNGAAKRPPEPPSYNNSHNNGATATAPSPYYNGGGYGGAMQQTTTPGYGSGYGGGGYSGASTYGNDMGMRQRRGGNVPNTTSTIPVQEQQEEEEKVHSQIQMRQHKRETQQRLNEARQAETMLGELGQMFGKMSTLISQQGETLEKIEDDVECALGDVTAGQEELTKLYGIKKGNRPLIIKTFAILNFLIIFMRAYYKK
jgi:hypothetical protein